MTAPVLRSTLQYILWWYALQLLCHMDNTCDGGQATLCPAKLTTRLTASIQWGAFCRACYIAQFIVHSIVLVHCIVQYSRGWWHTLGFGKSRRGQWWLWCSYAMCPKAGEVQVQHVPHLRTCQNERIKPWTFHYTFSAVLEKTVFFSLSKIM